MTEMPESYDAQTLAQIFAIRSRAQPNVGHLADWLLSKRPYFEATLVPRSVTTRRVRRTFWQFLLRVPPTWHVTVTFEMHAKPATQPDAAPSVGTSE